MFTISRNKPQNAEDSQNKPQNAEDIMKTITDWKSKTHLNSDPLVRKGSI